MNGQIVHFLSINGPSLIYSVAKHLAALSETKVHYPTVNRRMHDLLLRGYIEKAGTRITKAGTASDLYSTTLRGEFAAIAGNIELKKMKDIAPKEMKSIITKGSQRQGSPLVFLRLIYENDQKRVAGSLIEKRLIPELVTGIRNGYLNLDAPAETVICSAFASIIARAFTRAMEVLDGKAPTAAKKQNKDYIKLLISSLDIMTSARKTISNAEINPSVGIVSEVEEPGSAGIKLEGTKQHEFHQPKPISNQWCSELKYLLKIYSVM